MDKGRGEPIGGKTGTHREIEPETDSLARTNTLGISRE